MESKIEKKNTALLINKGLSKFIINFLTVLVDCTIVDCPEPSEDLNQGVENVKKQTESQKFDFLVAGSRGGQIVSELITKKIWQGPILLFSSMSTSSIIQPLIPIILVHGEQDGTNPIARVEEDLTLGTKELIKLIKLDDNHSLRNTITEEKIAIIVNELMELSRKASEIVQQPKQIPTTNVFNPAAARLQLLNAIKKK